MFVLATSKEQERKTSSFPVKKKSQKKLVKMPHFF